MTRVVDLRKKLETKESAPVIEKKPLVEKKIKEEAPSPIVNPLPTKTDRFEWEAPSFYHNPQKKYLAIVVTVLFLGAGALIFYNKDILMAIFLILSSLVIILYANKQPTISRVVVSQAGVTIDDKAYNYRDLRSFWLDFDPHGLKELSLEPKKWYLPYIKISIENQGPVELRSLMVKFIAEKEHEKSLVDLISKKIGL